MSTQLQKFIKLLEEMFQYDQADLDFGIYRIMNQRRDEVTRFLNQELVPQVKKAFEKYKNADIENIKQEIEKLEKQLAEMGVAKESSEKYQGLNNQLNKGIDILALENEVYSDLTNFFKRYYYEGDFLSLRRYKKDVYAIPYEGEEVKLHWANSDQYYVKSSENFRDYTLTLSSGNKVHFKLIDAETEQNNNKAQGKERRFILMSEEPILEENGELIIRFEYRPDEKNRNREKINEETVEKIFSFGEYAKWIEELKKLSPSENNKNRTILEKHINDYTAKNTFDYFIHKDLGGFLRRELDFYIKNEIMHLDDLDTENEKHFEQYLSKVKVIKTIGNKIIKFLEQIESFQKKLWLKKKFVIETNYCITLDQIPQVLYKEILNNKEQIEEWKKIFSIDEINTPIKYEEPLSIDFLEQNKYLVLDTKFFTTDFKNKLLSSIEDLDKNIDGLLINSDNFHAISLITEKYQKSIGTFYLDPPYNTKNNEFIFKDNYKHSSWLTMMENRLKASLKLMNEGTKTLISIDENEHVNLYVLLNAVFGEENHIGEIIWKGGSKNDQKYIDVSHEYILCYAYNKNALDSSPIRWTERKEGIDEIYDYVTELAKKYKDNYEEISKGLKEYFRNLPESAPAKAHSHYNWVDKRGIYFAGDLSKPAKGYYYDIYHPVTGKPCKKPAGGWRFIEETMKEKLAEDRIHFGRDENTIPNNKVYLKDAEEKSLSSVIYKDNRASSGLIKNMFNYKAFSNPKDIELLSKLFKAVGSEDEIFLDYFAGSGSTGHAVINLNKEDGGKRHYILVEMGEYFSSVTKPRIEKAIYSKDWRDGKPLSREGTSQIFKYIRLESYEDSLNNIQLKRTKQQEMALNENLSSEAKEDYYLSYMLDIESKGSTSLFNIEEFKNPFNYKMSINNGIETKLERIDLVETFNYLLGLNVKRMDFIRGFQVLSGELPSGENVLIIWRNLNETSNDDLEKFFVKQGYNSLDSEFDRIYVNGDNHLENLKLDGNKWKVVLIEEEFKRLMFDVQDV